MHYTPKFISAIIDQESAVVDEHTFQALVTPLVSDLALDSLDLIEIKETFDSLFN